MIIRIGRSSDLFFLSDAFPSVKESGLRISERYEELTAAGTVPEFHRIPFSSRSQLLSRRTGTAQR